MKTIEAAASADAGQSMVHLVCPLTITAAAEGDTKALPSFHMVAYTGGAMRIAGFPHPVVVDLNGLVIARQDIPVRLDHNSRQGVGHTQRIAIENGQVIAEGVISRATEWAQDVTVSGRNGFPWQASIGAPVVAAEFIVAGRTVSVNGRAFQGPLHVVRKAVLKEISFVDNGADAATSARIAAGNQENSMTFEQWLQAKGFEDPSTLSEAQTTNLRAMYDAEVAAQADDDKGGGTDDKGTGQTGNPPVKATGNTDDSDPIAQARAAAAAEFKRIAAVQKIAAQHPEIAAQAIEQGWDETKTELEVVRASRPKAPGINTGGAQTATPKVLEAAAIMAGGIDGNDLVRTYGEKVLDAAHTRFRHGIGLTELLMEAAWANGYAGRSFRSDPKGVLQAAFSSASLSGVLSNVANKYLLQGFMAVEQAWKRLAAVRSVSDFKTVTSYRLTADTIFEEVAPDGELKHAKVTEDSFTNRAKTYGKIFSVTRQDLINDDLGALTARPKMIGRGSGLKINDVFWSIFLNNAAFFKTANKNYAAGAGTALSIDALTAAILLFDQQTDTDGYPLAVSPKILAVPSALKVRAEQLMSSLQLNETTTADTPKPSDNPHAGKFEIVSSVYMSNSKYTGYSAAAWYLLADPEDVPAIEVAFLNGVQEPTVEEAAAAFNTLGIEIRGYFDFGVALQDYRGGVKMKGTA